MEDRIWNGINFSELDREIEEKKKEKKNEKPNKFITIINKVIKEKIGTMKAIEVEMSNDKIEIILQRCSITDFRIDGEYFIMYDWNGGSRNTTNNEFKFDNMEMFESYVRMSIDQKLIPQIKLFYKRGDILKLPKKLQEKVKVLDFSKITKKWITDTFENITEAIMNGETIENVIIKNKNILNISFDVNCGRYGLHSNCGLTINNKGFIKIDLDDTPLEGCGVEEELKDSIIELLNV